MVDSDENFKRQMIWALKTDYQLSKAQNRGDALKYLERERRPSVVLSDLHLSPRLDSIDEGLKVLNTFKENAPEVKVIIVSANSEEQTITRAKQLGADDYIVKPFKIDFLKSAIEKVILKSSTLGVERRRCWRVECELPISYSLIEPKLPISGRSKTINIGRDGVTFPADQSIAAGSLLDLELSLQSKLIARALGEVKWGKIRDGIYQIGVQFLKITNEDRHEIANYIYRL